MQCLFVYGTLLSSLRKKLNISFFEMDLFEIAFVYGNLYDLGNYPGLVLADEKTNQNKIYGELYTLPENFSFDELDEYEGYHPDDLQNSEYRRSGAEVFLLDDSKKKAWTYLYNKNIHSFEKICHGSYLAFKKM
ncbi:MAG: gamma-glutamylcyclotransferase [Spirochaetia bacterium]|nr:gamma-glutamylcyclotransferase [Spirochaetia bacterium]